MQQLRNLIVDGPHGKPMGVDIYFEDDGKPKPVVVFSHGFKGFKDWGHFGLVAEAFAKAGFVFVKFNFSHNGTSIESPADFVDLEAFGHNNFSVELDDLGALIDWLFQFEDIAENIDQDKLYLMGHSRGGGITILKAAEDARVKKIVTWSAISEIGKFWQPQLMAEWKQAGVRYVYNSRTQQEMPLYYQYCEDFFAHQDRLDIPAAAARLSIPTLYIHGEGDPVVPDASARKLHELTQGSQLLITEQSGHTFNARHPWTESTLPHPSDEVVQASIEFFKQGSF